MLMIHTGMLGIVVVTGNRENDVKSVASVLNEIGVGGLNIEIATDNESRSLGHREVIRGHSFRIRGFNLMFKRFDLC